LLLSLALAAGSCPLCPEGAQGPHDCCQRSYSPSCGHTQKPQEGKQPCPGGHPVFTGPGDAPAAGLGAPSFSQGDATVFVAPHAAAAVESGFLIEPALSPGHSPPPAYLQNSVLRI
jgi:hypothetical protein